MATATSKEPRIPEKFAARVLRAYKECSDDVQLVCQDMLDILDDEESTEQEKRLAGDTLMDALFPLHDGFDGELVERFASEGDDEDKKALDAQEAVFADRVKAIMEEKGVTQISLSERTGVQQSAISMMLSRNCRPQRRTIRKIAHALGVDERELWPSE